MEQTRPPGTGSAPAGGIESETVETIESSEPREAEEVAPGWWAVKRERIARQFQSDALRKIVANAGWLIGEKALLMVVALTVHVWMARYLGPSQFGILSYALSFTGLFGTFTYLGISGLATRDLVAEPEKRDEILGTVFLLKLAGGVIGVAIIVATTELTGHDALTRSIVYVVALSLLFDAFKVVDFWFGSRVESRQAVIATSGAALAAAGAKVGLILSRASLVAFAWVHVLQPALTAVGLTLVYGARAGSVRAWRFRWQRARDLLSQAWPLALSAVGAVIYLKVDQVMLGALTTPAEVGTYAVAARLSEIWYFIPAAIATSLFPKIVQSRADGPEIYHDRLQRIYNVMATLGISLALVVSLTSGFITDLLYDREYLGAGAILAVHIWACPVVFMGNVLSKWLIAENLLIFSLTRHLLGAVLNVVLNLFLIPRYGGLGAAIATLVAYSFASYLSCFTDRRTRASGVMMTRALAAPLFMLVRR